MKHSREIMGCSGRANEALDGKDVCYWHEERTIKYSIVGFKTEGLMNLDLTEANFQNAYFSGANFQGTTNFWRANFQEANLMEANLKEALLMYANLQEVNLVVSCKSEESMVI